jgi:hypothetical protein
LKKGIKDARLEEAYGFLEVVTRFAADKAVQRKSLITHQIPWLIRLPDRDAKA